MTNHKSFFVKHYLAASAFLLGVALSGLILSFYYTVNNSKSDSDRNLAISAITVVLGLAVGVAGKNLKGKE